MFCNNKKTITSLCYFGTEKKWEKKNNTFQISPVVGSTFAENETTWKKPL